MLAKLTEIQIEQKAQRELLNGIMQHMTSAQLLKKSEYNFEVGFFPLKTIQDLQNFDYLLRDNALAFDTMVNILYLFVKILIATSHVNI